MKYRTTKAGVAICPYFIWTSESIYDEGENEKDVNLTFCNHKDNNENFEGNCNEKLCPLLNEVKNEN